jgi:UDPglucose 6-dehydrogenase
MKNITVFGNGFVGSAYASLVSDTCNVNIVDPAYGMFANEESYNADGYMLCLPAPTLENGEVDYSILRSVIRNIREFRPSAPIMIKSTILPDMAEVFGKDPNIVYSPEFLTASNANRDVKTQKHMIIGGKNITFWLRLFNELGKQCEITDIKTASYFKYIVNTFLATKVAFLNELYDLYTEDGGEWKDLRSLFNLEPRLGTSHFDVPGPDGQRGYSGACFPKDMKAFKVFSEGSLSIVGQAEYINEKWRS